MLAFLTPSGSLDAAQLPGRLVTQKVTAAAENGRCQVTVLYPQVQGLANAQNQRMINLFLGSRFRGDGDFELKRAITPCPSTYMASIGFNATMTSTGLLSVKRTRAVYRGAGVTGSLETECHIVDMYRGGKIDVTRWLGDAGMAKLSELTGDAVRDQLRTHRFGKFELKRGNFSACLGDRDLLVQIGGSLMRNKEHALEARIPYEALRPWLARSPLASMLGAQTASTR